MTRNLISFVVIIFSFTSNFSQNSTYVDNQGVFRWSDSKKEIKLFGINYTSPFAHGYRAIEYLNKNHKKSIDKDVYHLARLDIDAYRVHIWDSEITDSLGNLIETKQLDLLDYLFHKLKERGIKTIITPFKVGGNGYPEKDFPTEGFSGSMNKAETYSGKNILDKQKRYFSQLLNHVNPYTKLAYKEDPDIIALEINNEPQHEDGIEALNYINYMVDVIRKAGFENPIFYNVSERSKFVDSYLKANIQGCTFQWYPTGLVFNNLLTSNFLPNVDHYNIPFRGYKEFKDKARIIYEFDPGDTNSSVLYPAMARSFREAGFQFVAQFAYDPIDLAFANTEYQTHYLNLAYTPSKAISLKIASAAFHEIPIGKSFGRYPNNKTFLNTKLDENLDLSVYNSLDKFFYSNSNTEVPRNSKKLSSIAGVGNSSIVQYDGTGAYFLDKLSNGDWRLEVLPDVLWVNDPFEKASLKKTVAILQENWNSITIDLPSLNSDFYVFGINENNELKIKAVNGKAKIKPGTYILSNNSSLPDIGNTKLNAILLNEYASTNKNIDKVFLNHKPKKYITSNSDLTIEASVVAPTQIQKVELIYPSGYHKTENYELIKKDNFKYTLTIPSSKINHDEFSYHLTVYTDEGSTTFPDSVTGDPIDWDFVGKNMYKTDVVVKEYTINLFDAGRSNFSNFLWPRQWNAIKYKINKVRFKDSNKNMLSVSANSLKAKHPDLTFKILMKDETRQEIKELNSAQELIFKASSGDKSSQKIQLGLQLNDGQVYGKEILLTSELQEYKISFNDLKRVDMVLLPRPYPDFQHYYFRYKGKSSFDIKKLEAIQISIGPGLKKSQLENKHHLMIQNIDLK